MKTNSTIDIERVIALSAEIKALRSHLDTLTADLEATVGVNSSVATYSRSPDGVLRRASRKAPQTPRGVEGEVRPSREYDGITEHLFYGAQYVGIARKFDVGCICEVTRKRNTEKEITHEAVWLNRNHLDLVRAEVKRLNAIAVEKRRKSREYERAFVDGEKQNPFNKDA